MFIKDEIKKLAAEIEKEIVSLNDFLAENGVQKPVSFAYPGGPYAENAVPVLKKYGFAVETNKNVYTYKLENIYILIQQDYTYQISFDYGNTYTNLYDCNIGVEQDRNKVKNDLIEYEGSHPVDKQRGDAIDTLASAINFLKKNIDEILNCKVNK